VTALRRSRVRRLIGTMLVVAATINSADRDRLQPAADRVVRRRAGVRRADRGRTRGHAGQGDLPGCRGSLARPLVGLGAPLRPAPR